MAMAGAIPSISSTAGFSISLLEANGELQLFASEGWTGARYV
jgi:hypothetical protein